MSVKKVSIITALFYCESFSGLTPSEIKDKIHFSFRTIKEERTVKKNSFERALNTRLRMQLCEVSVFLIDKTWLNDYFNEDPEIVTQVTVSKELSQPLILMIDQNLTRAERKSIEQILQKHTVITKMTFDPDNFGKSKPELDKALELYNKKYAKSRAGK